MRAIIGAALFLLPFAARADQTLARPISWWKAHPAEMRQTIAICHDNSQLANTATCVNAEAAAVGLRAQQWSGFSQMFTDTRYWSANPVARDAELARCASGISMLPQYCRYVAQSALQDARAR